MYLFKKPPLLLCVTEINQAAATSSTQEVQELEAAQRTNERMNGRTFSMSHCANLLIDRTASKRSEETTKRKGFLSVDRSINNISSTNLFPYKSSLIEGLLFFFGFFLGLFQDFANGNVKSKNRYIHCRCSKFLRWSICLLRNRIQLNVCTFIKDQDSFRDSCGLYHFAMKDLQRAYLLLFETSRIELNKQQVYF